MIKIRLTKEESKARRKARHDVWRIANPNYGAAWQAANKEHAKALGKAYRESHREHRRAVNAAWRKANPEKVKSYYSKYRTIHPDRRKASVKISGAKHYAANSGRKKAIVAVWQKCNPAKCRANKAKRRTIKLNATPPWVDFCAIKDVYLEADYMQLDVDHIVPLQSKLVCGLHVWDNLQLLTKSENSAKGNRFEVGD